MNIDDYKAFAQDIAAVMRKHEAYSTDIKFRLTGDGVFEEARMTYNRGRHGTPGTLNLIITTQVSNFKEEINEN